MTAKDRVFGFDLLRCLAILLVLVTHTILFLNPAFYKVAVYTGLMGVEFFFVLSGFLIGIILLKIYHEYDGLDWTNLKIFWIRRWFRTLPNYYFMFIIYALLIYISHHLNVFAHFRYSSYLLFLQNATHYQPEDFFQVAWSLSIEEWFYLVFPFLLFCCCLIFKNKRKVFISIIGFFLIAEFLVRIYVAVTQHTYWDEGFRKLMPMRLDSIVMGVLAAYCKFNFPSFWERKVALKSIIGFVLLLFLISYFAIKYVKYYDSVTWDHNFNPDLFLKSAFFTLLSFAIALQLPLLNKLNAPQGIIERFVLLISNISYSIYLSHYFIILLLSHIFIRLPTFPFSNQILFITIWIVVIGTSTIQYNYFEVKMTALRNHFSKRQIHFKV